MRAGPLSPDWTRCRKQQERMAEREHREAICAIVPEEDLLMIKNPRTALAVGLAELDARIARVKNDPASEIRNWAQGVELQDKLGYREPPDWHYPIRESMGGRYYAKAKAPKLRLKLSSARTSSSIRERPFVVRSDGSLQNAKQAGFNRMGEARIQRVRKALAHDARNGRPGASL